MANIYDDEDFKAGKNAREVNYEVEETFDNSDYCGGGGGYNGGYNDSGNKSIQGANNPGTVISWIEKLGNIFNKFGLKTVLECIILIIFLIVLGFGVLNPSALIRKFESEQEKIHTEKVMDRTSASPVIRTALVDLRTTLNADRAFVFETHNGGSNLGGLPFLYIDMTYDEPKSGLGRVQDEYKNVSQTRYPLMDIVYNDNFWFGHIDELLEFDPELYYRLSKKNVTYVAILATYGEFLCSGAVGVEYLTDKVPSEAIIRRELYRYAAQIGSAIVPQKK